MRVLVLAALCVVTACGSGGTDVPTLATVVFTYDAPTAADPAAAQQAPSCVAGVGPTHLHASWQMYMMVPMVANGPNQWVLAYADVPVGVQVFFRINDGNVCPQNPTGAVTVNIRANGVLLTDLVQTPGMGPEPGLAFRVDANGVVTP
jgi:hypothetical protein